MPPLVVRPIRVARPLRARLPRSAVPWWIAVVLLAALTASLVGDAFERAEHAEQRWGRTRMVAVATRPIEAGAPLTGVATRRLPRAAIPDGALGSVPGGRVAVAAIGRGEVVVASRVSGAGASSLAGRLPPGTRAVLVPVEVPGLPVEVGDRVDLLSTGSTDLPSADGHVSPAGPVARSALVVRSDRTTLVVALDPSSASALAAALGQGPVVPALVAPAAG